jgi:hypothetical protein
LLSGRGSTLIELVVALGLSLAITSVVFLIVNPGGDAFHVQPEAADLQQRLRASSDALARDLLVAGNGPAVGAVGAPGTAAALLPLRVGRISPDAPGTFNQRRISILSVSSSAPQAVLASPLASAAGTATFSPGAGCHEGATSCGFRMGMLVAVFGGSGVWDLFSVTGAGANTLTLQHNLRDAALVHRPIDSTVAEVAMHTFMLKDDPAGFSRLVRYDGAGAADQPVADHIVELSFEYMGDPRPPEPVIGTDPIVPRTTYGPAPPSQDVQPTAYPPGENCVFTRLPTGYVVPRLPALAASPALVPLPSSRFVDGPWCPDGTNPNRYDADLLRVREVIVSIRVEAAILALRGPAGPLFSRGGTARATRMVPDRSVRLTITPRPLNLSR